MDEEPREADESVEREERTPEELQAEIEATRRALGDTVAAVAEKADVKRQARRQIDGVKHAIHAKREQLIGPAGTGPSGPAGEGMQQVTAMARENPLPLAVGGALVLGFLLGRRRASR
jgi:hypothetical protein